MSVGIGSVSAGLGIVVSVNVGTLGLGDGLADGDGLAGTRTEAAGEVRAGGGTYPGEGTEGAGVRNELGAVVGASLSPV
jgi:hypothetical protein